jgi:hypothetical protein
MLNSLRIIIPLLLIFSLQTVENASIKNFDDIHLDDDQLDETFKKNSKFNKIHLPSPSPLLNGEMKTKIDIATKKAFETLIKFYKSAIRSRYG